ncbi:hypothetical protein RHS03_05439, partial [Rhizoctonia solani]
MALDSKSSEVSDEARGSTSLDRQRSVQHSIGPLANGNPRLPTTSKPTTTDDLSSGIALNYNLDEPPPAYEAVTASPFGTLSPQPSSSQDSGSSSTIQIPIDSRVLPDTVTAERNQPHEIGTNSIAQENDDTQTHNVNLETTHTPLSTDPLSCFQRSAPDISELITYEKLQSPLVIQGGPSKHKLPDLFSVEGVPALFKHDVHVSDWRCFVHDLITCTRYSTGQRAVANAFPTVRNLGPPGTLICFATEQSMRKGRLSNSLALLDTWNTRFFKPRRLEVILCKGDKCKSGRRVNFLAPDRMNTPISSSLKKGDKEVGSDYHQLFFKDICLGGELIMPGGYAIHRRRSTGKLRTGPNLTMIIDAITSRDLKAHTSSGAGGLVVSRAIGSVDRGSFYTESVGGSVLRTSGDLITPIRSSVIDDQGRGTGCDPALDPPPAYETIVAPLTPNDRNHMEIPGTVSR